MEIPSDALLARYLSGDCSAVEAREIERWAASDPAFRARLDDFRFIAQGRWPPSRPSVDTAWAGVRRAIRPRERRGRRVWFAVAAVLLAVAGGGLLWQYGLGALPSVFAIRSSTPMRQFTTPRGQRATFQLSDGTRLTLAAESRLSVPENYGRGVREVFLEGEALFDVVHDSTRPFRVRAKHATAEDLGTRFNVRAYPENAAVAVAVAEGMVALGPATPPERRDVKDVPQGIVLRRGELGTLTSDGRVTTATGAAVAAHLAWAAGRLRFLATPLPDVALAVGRWYDLDVRIEGPALASRTVTAEFEVQSADELLQTLASVLDAQVSRSGRVVTLRPK